MVPLPAMRSSLVVLVHGAFGFGPEWDPIVAKLRQNGQPFVAFEWRGPFHDLTGAVVDLGTLLQRALDEAPGAREILVLAHSAGGPLATRAALSLRVREGSRVFIAELDSPSFMTGRPFFRTRISASPEMPPGVERTLYRARGTPKLVPPHTVYLGRWVSHGHSVALAGLPLVEDLAVRSRASVDAARQ